MSHDQNFKNLILDYPHQALAFFAEAEAQHVDPQARIVPVRQEQLQERLGERFRELDVPLLVEWPDGRREAILFVIEEQTEPRRFSIHRLAHYCLELSELFRTERVVPVVIFLSRAPNVSSHLAIGGDRHTYLRFHYLACALGALPYQRFRDSDNLVARLNLPNMDYRGADKVEVYAQAVRGLTRLEPDPERQLKYLDFIDIYADLDDNQKRLYTERYPQEAQTMTRFAERFREEGKHLGIQQGMQQGIQQGMQQGEAAVLLRQIERKFGPQAAATHRPRIEQADPETLLRWSERLLGAGTAEEIFH